MSKVLDISRSKVEKRRDRSASQLKEETLEMKGNLGPAVQGLLQPRLVMSRSVFTAHGVIHISCHLRFRLFNRSSQGEIIETWAVHFERKGNKSTAVGGNHGPSVECHARSLQSRSEHPFHLPKISTNSPGRRPARGRNYTPSRNLRSRPIHA